MSNFQSALGELLHRPLNWVGLCGLALAVLALSSGSEAGPLVLLALVPLLAILGGLALIRPEWVMLAVIAYIPFDSSAFRPLDLPAGLSVSKLLGILLTGSLVFAVVARKRRFRLLDSSLDIAVLMLAIFMLLSLAVSAFPGHTLEALMRMARMFVLYFAIRNLIESREQLTQILWTILLSGSAAALYGIVSFYRARLVRVHDIRVGGVHMDPNDFAITMVVVLAVGVHLLHFVRRPLLRGLVVLALAISAWAFLLSGSRGGVLSLVVVASVYIWRRPDRTRILAASLLLVAVSIPVWPAGVKDRFLGPLISADNGSVYADTAKQSSRRRISYVTYGLSLVASRPLTGHGYDSFEKLHPHSEFARFQNPMEDRERFRPAHNGYLEYAVGMGLPGLAGFLLTLGLGLYALNRAVERMAGDRTSWAALQAFELGLIGILVGNVFLSFEHSKYLWTILAIAAATAHLSAKTAPADVEERLT